MTSEKVVVNLPVSMFPGSLMSAIFLPDKSPVLCLSHSLRASECVHGGGARFRTWGGFLIGMRGGVCYLFLKHRYSSPKLKSCSIMIRSCIITTPKMVYLMLNRYYKLSIHQFWKVQNAATKSKKIMLS